MAKMPTTMQTIQVTRSFLSRRRLPEITHLPGVMRLHKCVSMPKYNPQINKSGMT
jgi:hypothetical protein